MAVKMNDRKTVYKRVKLMLEAPEGEEREKLWGMMGETLGKMNRLLEGSGGRNAFRRHDNLSLFLFHEESGRKRRTSSRTGITPWNDGDEESTPESFKLYEKIPQARTANTQFHSGIISTSMTRYFFAGV